MSTEMKRQKWTENFHTSIVLLWFTHSDKSTININRFVRLSHQFPYWILFNSTGVLIKTQDQNNNKEKSEQENSRNDFTNIVPQTNEIYIQYIQYMYEGKIISRLEMKQQQRH